MDVLNIESEEESDEDPGQNDVPESEHSEVVGTQSLLQKILWKHHCNTQDNQYEYLTRVSAPFSPMC